ncbi:MAG: hypothetical protein RBR15_15795 [Sphaerochaeta sp.]|nr:hypothetical protein [Sphaerochaeta sp.]
MNIHARLSLVLSCLLFGATLAAVPLATQLSFAHIPPLLAQDSLTGQLVEPEEGSVEAFTAQALGEPYTLAWVERYVPEDVRYSFVRTFDQDLSLLLPQTMLTFGKAVHRQESLSVPFRYGKEMRSGTFVWIEMEPGEYTLLSISLNP